MSREEVIRRIVEREMQGHGLTEEVVLQHAPELHQSACALFGTWDTALEYAGVTMRRVSVTHGYTRERVRRQIRQLCLNGYSLMAVHNMRRDRRLYESARQYFGTWRQALLAAGIDLKHARLSSKPRRLDKQEIIDTLRQRHQAGLSLAWNEVCLENRALASAARNAFRSWRRALVAAGIIPEIPHAPHNKKWDKQRIIEMIEDRYREGKPLSYTQVRKDHAALTCAARRHFGSWGRALAAAGGTLEERVCRPERSR